MLQQGILVDVLDDQVVIAGVALARVQRDERRARAEDRKQRDVGQQHAARQPVRSRRSWVARARDWLKPAPSPCDGRPAAYAPPVPPLVRLRRLGYRLAFRVLQVRWLLSHPDQRGVKCVITDGDRLLLVRHTYGMRAWDLPGGRTRRCESALATTRREMEEELGLGDAPWHELGELRGRLYRRRDTIHILGAEVSAPTLRVDPVELEAAAWFDRDRLPLWVTPYVRPTLDGVTPCVAARAGGWGA